VRFGAVRLQRALLRARVLVPRVTERSSNPSGRAELGVGFVNFARKARLINNV
jgi:hypothetical protein